jgi:hypothetical protein
MLENWIVNPDLGQVNSNSCDKLAGCVLFYIVRKMEMRFERVPYTIVRNRNRQYDTYLCSENIQA